MPVSEPAADFEGRNAVYAMKYHALLSAMYPGDLRFRETLKDELAGVMKTVEPTTRSRL
ncbi:hypothetical protein IMZ48_05455 [Candidatus Bathyarchaeota archaeon]|nr:hypothetical protein [Candidatus Bathyarchaeota archaeon]